MLIHNNYKPYMVQKKTQEKTTVEQTGGRLVHITCMIGLAFSMLAVYAYYVQSANHDQLMASGEARIKRSIKEPALRGTITDRNGAVLAVSRHVKMPTFNPKQIYQPKRLGDPINWNIISDAQFAKLAEILGLPEGEVRAKLQNIDSSYVKFKTISLEDADKLNALKIPSLRFENKTERTYPTGRLFSHIIGFTNSEGKGLEGLELSRNQDLTGQDGKQLVLRDGKQKTVALLDSPDNQAAHAGQNLTLSVDESMQRLAHEELTKAVAHFNAKAGAVVVLDAQTGEILAMSSLPDYDANFQNAYSAENKNNYAVGATIEPGSIIKPFIVAKALDDGKISEHTWMETKPFTIGKKLIHDTHHYPSLDVEGILKKSSNVGVSKIALMYENQDLYQFYHSIGLGKKTQSGVSGEQNIPIKSAQTWSKLDKAVMSYGYAISANLLQMAQGYTIFTTNGRLLPATIYKQTTPVQGTQVIRPASALKMRRLMISITEKGGTGVAGAVPGYDVAAKTGTAHKLIDGRYEKVYRASFVGFAPALNPRLIVAVSLDEPRNNSFYGGTVAGPVFRNVMSGGLKLLGVKPTKNIDSYDAS